jgi:hypothetical protein
MVSSIALPASSRFGRRRAYAGALARPTIGAFGKKVKGDVAGAEPGAAAGFRKNMSKWRVPGVAVMLP